MMPTDDYSVTTVEILNLAQVKSHAALTGKTLKTFINEAIQEKISRDLCQPRLHVIIADSQHFQDEPARKKLGRPRKGMGNEDSELG